MGIVSGTVLEYGGKVTGIVPYAMVISGGEREKGDPEKALKVELNEQGREAVSILMILFNMLSGRLISIDVYWYGSRV